MYKKIKSYEDACKAIGIDPEHLPEVSNLPEDLAQYIVDCYRLAVVNQAINGKWRADYGNHDQRKFYPWFSIEEDYVPGSGGGFSFLVSHFDLADTRVGARLAYETREQADYAGKTFADLYEKVYLIPQS